MADRLLNGLQGKVTSLELEPSRGGCFELTVDGKLVFSKLQTGRFPTDAEVMGLLGG